MGLLTDICVTVARTLVRRRKPGQAGERLSTFDARSYREWRDAELRKQFTTHFSASEVLGADVLDFGCGEGGLSFLAADLGAQSVTGIDLNEKLIRSALDHSTSRPVEVRPRFLVATDPVSIDLPDQSVDLILCFDVLEHVLAYREIIREWRRVLRPNGRVFVWWVPWFHPYGHHIESLVPIPWAHVVFPEKVLVDACARLYEATEFRPRCWDLDCNGSKKPNKWLTLKELPDVNRLTISQFEATCRQIGLTIDRRQIAGFGGSFLSRMTRVLTRLPVFQEFFAGHVTYRLRKSARAQARAS